MGGLPLSLRLTRAYWELLQRHSMPQSLQPQEAETPPFLPPPCSFQPLSLDSHLNGEGHQTLLPSLVLLYHPLQLLDQLLAPALSSGFCSSSGREGSHLYYTFGCSLGLKYRHKINFKITGRVVEGPIPKSGLAKVSKLFPGLLGSLGLAT